MSESTISVIEGVIPNEYKVPTGPIILLHPTQKIVDMYRGEVVPECICINSFSHGTRSSNVQFKFGETVPAQVIDSIKQDISALAGVDADKWERETVSRDKALLVHFQLKALTVRLANSSALTIPETLQLEALLVKAKELCKADINAFREYLGERAFWFNRTHEARVLNGVMETVFSGQRLFT